MEVFIDGTHKGRYFDPSIPAYYEASDGDILTFVTFDCFSNMITSDDQMSSKIALDDINPATGPVAIKGAEPGDILRIDVLDIKIADTGLMAEDPNLGGLKEAFTEEKTHIFKIENGKIHFNDSIELDVDPMIGVIGTSPADCVIDTDTPDFHGGNVDCTRIRKGATVFLPVNVKGANLSIGDCHALMGDGEIVLCGMECAAEVRVKVSVIKNKKIPTPAVLDKDVFCTMVSADTLDKATHDVVYAMHSFLVEQIGMNDYDAAFLMSLVGNLRINQIVDPLLTVRVEMPRKYFDSFFE